jgi:hypothetical protein
MALDIELSVAVASDVETFVVTDDTTYGTGGNPARSAVGVFLNAYKMSYDNEATELDVTSDDTDPETDSEFTVDYDSDGWFKMYFVIIPDFNTSSTYSIYDAVFNPTDNKVYRSKTNSNTEDTLTSTTYWEEITDPATLANNKDTATESTNITSTIYHRVLSANAQLEFGNALSNQNPRENDDDEESFREYLIWAKMLDEVSICDSRTEVLSGELICRRIESRFINNA